MKNSITQWLGALLCLCLSAAAFNAQTVYTNIYDGVTYTSPHPYNLNIVYFVPNDVPLDPTYKTRVSKLMLYAQSYYKDYMIKNGFGAKEFGLFKSKTDPNIVKIIVIKGALPHTAYTYADSSKESQEIGAYFASNPSQKTSSHTLVLTALLNINASNVPFYGLGRTAYGLDYPEFDLQYLNNPDIYGQRVRSGLGGLLHELGHGINLPHSRQTITEYNNPNQGMNLMALGNQTFGKSPTFINSAGSAILNTCQIFANVPGNYYNGNDTKITSLNASFSNGKLHISGTFYSNRVVTGVNIYQDPHATPNTSANNRTAWSVKPSGNSFSISMPKSELLLPSQTVYNLQFEIILENGEYAFFSYPFNYSEGIPDITNAACVGGTIKVTTPLTGTNWQWQYQNTNGTWSNYPDGTVNGYATFSGTKTNVMTVSNISKAYINNPNTVRAAIKQADGTTKYSSPQVWRVYGINTQPVSASACVGGSLQLAASAKGIAYQWQFQNADGTWSNYPEKTLTGYATFSGTRTPTMTVSNISSYYASHPNQARLVVYGLNGCYTASNTVTWKANNCSKARIADASEKQLEEPTVYPNPVKDVVNINLGNEKEEYEIQIVNSLGTPVFRKTISETTLSIPFSDKLAGIYIIQIKNVTKGNVKSFRIIKK
ncbi:MULTISPECIES: T9SS type A sorting domain-containing protein [unclassified Chryseobacterium]|uniref:T9SS type A sorting domain-containing protein n=1 Tax=unclassified Chryseobacterium TaxID=2593645 RepID=UPI002269EE5D|nr:MULTISPECIES: T9SS type A sorting domain-containing protein [unclassified Chryseobacterium]